MKSNSKDLIKFVTVAVIVISLVIVAMGAIGLQTDIFAQANNEDSSSTEPDLSGVSVWTGNSDTSCYSFSSNLIEITEAAHLRGIADMASNGFDFSPYVIKLATDIDLDGRDWIPFSNFGGTFDGQGHTISNGNIVADDNNGTGFFGNLYKITVIENLVFKKMTVSSNVYMNLSVVAGSNSANGTRIDNVNLYNCFVNASLRKGQNNGSFYITSSTGAMIISDCNVYDSVYYGAWTANAFAYSMQSFEYMSKVVNCNTFNTFLIGPENTAGTIINNGNGTTIIENCHSDLYPKGNQIDGIRDRFTSEQLALYDNAMKQFKRLAYAFTLGDACEIDSKSGGVFNVSLDDTDITSNFYENGSLSFEDNEYGTFTLDLLVESDISVTVNQTVKTVRGKSLTVEIPAGTSVISYSYDVYGVAKSGRVVTGVNSAFGIYTSDNQAVEDLDSFIGSDGYNFNVSSFADGYVLKPLTSNELLTMSSNDVAIGQDGVAFVYDSVLKKYALSVDIEIQGKKKSLSFIIWSGVNISLTGSYPMAYDEANGLFRSSNQKKSSSQSEIEFIVGAGYTLSFEYACSSENKYDYLYFDANGTVTNTCGENTDKTEAEILASTEYWKTYTFENTSSEPARLLVYYKKDGSGDNGADTAYIKNITFSVIDSSSQSGASDLSQVSPAGDTAITLPDDAIKISDNLYYICEDAKKFVYDEKTGYYSPVKDSANSASITFYIVNSDVFRFMYDDTTYYDNNIDVYLDGVHQQITGDKESEINLISRYFRFDTVGTHSIKFSFNYYDWYSCVIANPEAFTYSEFNVNITVSGNGEVYDIMNFANTLLGSTVQKGLFEKIQLFGKTDVNGAHEFYGYRIKQADGEYGDLIETNGKILEVLGDMDILVEFRERIGLANPIDYTLIVNGVSQNGKIYLYSKMIFDTFPENTEVILQTPLIDGTTVKAYDSATETLINLIEDKGVYYYKVNDFTADHEIKFIYEKDGYKTTAFVIQIAFIADINTYLVKEESLPVEIINDSTLPFKYFSQKSSTDKYAFVSSLMGKNVHSVVSNIGFKVKGTGMLVFDYYVSTQDRKEISGWDTPYMGDKALYGIDTKIDKSMLTNRYFISDDYLDKIGYLGADLGVKDYSKCQGLLGWQQGAVAVGAEEDEYTTIYLAYVKDADDDGGEPSEDAFAIANVMFVQGDYTVSYSTNSTTATVTASKKGVAFDSGSIIPAGSYITFSVSNIGDSERFAGWYDSNGYLRSYETEYSINISRETDLRAVFAGETAPFFVDRTPYATLTEAIESLKNGNAYNDGVVRCLYDFTLTEDVIVPQNVTLLLSYSIKDRTGYSIGGNNARTSWYAGVDPYVSIVVPNGITLTVNGNVIVGGVQHKEDQSGQGHTSGAYAQIVNNGNIVVSDGGYFDVRGRVSGSGTIIVDQGATLREPFIVNNYSGGTNTSGLYSNGQFPFSQFATINVECRQTVHYGAKIIGSTSLYFWESITTQDVVLVDVIENKTLSSEGALIWMQSGSRLEISQNQNQTINQKVGNIHLGDFGVTVIDVYGSITAGEFLLQGYGSEDMVLAIPYTYNFNIKDGAVVTLNHAYKIMPGAIVIVEDGGSLNIESAGSLYVYDGLIQADKNGKVYPSADVLGTYGFYKSGMLIVNGTLKIDGTFAGIVQSTGENGTIVVGDKANVGTQTVTEGSSGGYTDNTMVFTTSGRYYGFDGIGSLEQGKTYKRFSDKDFVLSTFTADHVARIDQLTVTLNQAMQGRFLEWNGEKFVAYVTFFIGDLVENVKVTVNDVTYQTDVNGRFVAKLLISSENETIYYYATEIYREIKETSIVLDSEQTLSYVVKSVELDDDNVYERIYDKDGNVTKDFVLKAKASFYASSDIQTIALSCDASLSGVYVNEKVVLSANNLLVDLKHDLIVVNQDVARFIFDVDELANATDVVAQAITLYERFNALTTAGSSVDIAFIGNYLKNKDYFASLIVKEIGAEAKATYGDKSVSVSLTYVDGSIVTATASATLSDWEYKDNRVIATATYSATFENTAYDVTAVCTASRKNVTVTVDDKTSVYGDSLVELTAINTTELAFDDVYSDLGVVLTKESGNNAKSYEISGNWTNLLYQVMFENGVYTITPKNIVVTVDDKTSVYGDSIADLTATATGLAYGEEYSVLKAVLTKADGLTVGEYEISGTYSNSNYVVEFVNGTYKITPKNVVVTVADKTSVYGDSIADLTATATELAYGEEYSVLGVVLSRADGLTVGEYEITGTYSNSNYVVEFVNGTYTITPKNVIVYVADKTSVYGDSIADLTATATELPYDEDYSVLKVVLSRADGLTVGKYEITGTYSNSNYAVEFVKGVYTITPKNVVVTVDDKTSVYGDSIADLTATATELAYDEEYSVLGVVLTKADGLTVGKYEITGTYSNSNYAVEFVNGTYTITAKDITVTIDDKTSVYGDSIVELTAEASKLAYDDVYSDLDVRLTKENGSNVGNYAINGTWNNANYNVSFVGGIYSITEYRVTIEITKPSNVMENRLNKLVISASAIAPDANYVNTLRYNLVKDGQIYATVDKDGTVTVSQGLVLSVGSYSIVAINDNQNYIIEAQNEVYLEIVAENNYYEVDFDLPEQSRVYDGTTTIVNPTVKVKDTQKEVTDFVYSITLNNVESVIKNVGIYLIEVIVTEDGEEVIFTETYTITPKNVVVTVSDKTSVYGDSIADLTATATELAYGEEYSVLGVVLTKADGLTVGEYEITGSYSNANYVVEFVNGTYTITPKNVVVTIDDKTSVYGDSIVEFTATATELAYDEEYSVLNVVLTKADGLTVGEYEITGSYSNANYVVEFVNGTYTITPKNVVVTVSDKTSVYGDSIADLTATATKLAYGEEYSVLGVVLSKADGLTVGEYEITGTFSNANYTVEFVNGTYTITPKKVVVTVADKTSVYGDSIADLTATATELAYGEEYSVLDVVLTKADGLIVGKYEITGSYSNANYTVEFVNGTYTITPKNVIVTVADKTSVYGDSIADLTATATKLAYDEEYSVLGVVLTKADGLTVGEYKITGTYSNSNYVVEFVKGTYTITPKKVVVTIDDKTSVYGDSIAVLTASVTGLAYDEDYSVLDVALTKAYGLTVAEYEITGTYSNANYTVEFENGTYSIVPKDVTITILDKSSDYGDDLLRLEFIMTDVLPYNETSDDLGIVLARENGSVAKEYKIYLESYSNKNYNVLVAEEGKYTINKLSLSVAVESKESVYGEDLLELTFNVIGGKFAPKENVDVLNASLTIDGDAKYVGRYAIKFAYDNENYDVNVTEGVYAVTQRNVTLKVQDVTAIYGDEDTPFELTVTSGSLVYGDDVNSLVELQRTHGNSVGSYDIVCVNDCANNNYRVKVTFTSVDSSSYVIVKRSITLKVADVSNMPYTIDWQTLSANFSYSIVSGNLAYDDVLSVDYKVIVKDEILDESNFSDKIVGGTHSITLIVVSDNYAINIENGELTITLPMVSLTDKAFGLEFVYGETQNVFDWKTMLSGYMPSASERTFRAEFFAPDDLTVPVELDGAGLYKMQIVIVHETEYNFANGTKRSEFVDVIVKKADITDKIEIVVDGLSSNGYVVDSFGLTVTAFIQGFDVEIDAVLVKNGETVTEIVGVGSYVFTATVNDANYTGSKTVAFKVVLSAKDKIEKLIKLAGLDRFTDADLNAYLSIRDSLTEDDYMQIDNNESATDALETISKLVTTYRDETRKTFEDIKANYLSVIELSDRSAVRFFIRNIYETAQNMTATQKTFLSDEEKDIIENQITSIYLSSEKEVSDMIAKIETMLNEYKDGDKEKLFDAHDYIVSLQNDDFAIVKADEQGQEYAKLWNETYDRTQQAITVSDKIASNVLFVVFIAVSSALSTIAFAIAKMLGC